MIYRFGDIFDIVDGDRGANYPKEGDFFDDGYCLFLNAGNVTKTGWSFNKVSFISKYKDSQLRKGRLERGNTVFTTRGTIGNAAYYGDNIKFDHIRINSGMVILKAKDKQIIDDEFIYYLVTNPIAKKKIELFCSGSAQPQLPIKDFIKIKFNLPSLKIQKKIVSIIGSYDNLIENNNRRIRLLEQMAENLYKEWFVRFRFPGHEKTEFENGLPKGWKIERLDNYGRVETGKTPSMEKPEYYGGDILFIKTPDMHGSIYVRQTEECLSEKGNLSQPKKLLPVGSIMVSCIGSAGVVSINAKPAHTNQQINSIILSDKINLEWLYFTCKSLKPTIELFGATGATMTNLSKGKFERLKVIEPSYNLRKAFHNKVTSIFDAILKLDEEISILSRQRDLLLPRLMSGKLEVKV